MDTHSSWKNVLVFMLKTIATLTLLSFVLTNIVLSLTEMEGCEGRPDLSLHLVLAIVMALILGFYIYLGHIDITKGMDNDDMTAIGRRFGCDLEAQNRMFFMSNMVVAVQLLSCGAYLGFYHLYSTAILPRACTHPPSTLAKVYYWSVAGISGLIGLGCALFGICVLGYLAVMQAKEWLAQYRDKRQLKRLLQTVNDVHLTQSSASRLTFLLTHLHRYLCVANDLPRTTEIAWKIFTDNNINLCTVFACDVCEADEGILTKCDLCEERFERADSIVLLFESRLFRHRDCMLSFLSLEDAPSGSALGLDWRDQHSALEAIRDEHRAKNGEWSIEAIRKERMDKVKEIIIVDRLSQIHDSHSAGSEGGDESSSSIPRLPRPRPYHLRPRPGDAFPLHYTIFTRLHPRRSEQSISNRESQHSSEREESDHESDWMNVGSLWISRAPRRHQYKGRGRRRRYWRRVRMMRMSKGR